MILLGLDAGSTAIKCVAFSEEGRQLALAYTEYGTSAGAGNMDADAMFAAAKQVIARCTADDAVDALRYRRDSGDELRRGMRADRP